MLEDTVRTPMCILRFPNTSLNALNDHLIAKYYFKH